MSSQTEDSGGLDVDVVGNSVDEKAYYELYGKKIELERELMRSSKGLRVTHDFAGNQSTRSELIEALEQLSELASQLARAETKESMIQLSDVTHYRSWAAQYAGEAAYHRKFVEMTREDPSNLADLDVIREALAVKEDVKATVLASFGSRVAA